MRTGLTAKAGNMRQWVIRRQLKGIEPTADQVWTHIVETWPSLSEEEHEWIFQASDPGSRATFRNRTVDISSSV